MKKRISLVIALGVLCSLWFFSQAYASHPNAFTFFIPYPPDQIAEQFRVAQPPPTGGPNDFVVNGVETTISISGYRSGTIIYYDHWEDGLEANIYFPIQRSTEVWGDGDFTNGVSPANPTTDLLVTGDVIALQTLVPVPRDRTQYYYDGGDKLVPVGSPIAVTEAVWPDTAGILFADAWELYPTSRWGDHYVVPIGVDVPRRRGGFTTVGLNVQAVERGTVVQLDLDANGTFEETVTLNEGEQFTRVNGVRVGAEIMASDPVQVHVFTGDPASTFEARFYTMLPRGQWTGDYLAPRSSDGDYWLYNPNDADLEVLVETVVGASTITIPANGFTKYPPLPIGVLDFPTGVRFTSTTGEDFYGVVALDADSAQDWGYSLLPTDNLTTQAIIGWAPGNNNPVPDGDESHVYVTAATTTTVYVDYDNNGTQDASYPVTPLAETPIFDPDHDLTGARIYTDNTPFIAVWGQDQSARAGLPSIDVGTNIVPLSAAAIQKTYTLIEEGYDCGDGVDRGNIVRFKLQAFNNTIAPLTNVTLQDTLPPGIAYVLGTTQGGGSQIGDDTSGTAFPLDEEGYVIGAIPELGAFTITHDATIQDPGDFVNHAELLAPGADPAGADIFIPFHNIEYEVGTTLIDPSSGLVDGGQVITFGVTITNTGQVTITQLPLQDVFNRAYLVYHSASVPPTSTDFSTTMTPPFANTGAIAWADITDALGDLAPNTAIDLFVSFTVVENIPSQITNPVSIAYTEGVQDSAENTRAIMCGSATMGVIPPVVPPPTEPPPSEPPPGTPPPATPPPATPPPATPPPVVFLPETGVGRLPAAPLWPLAALPLLIGLLAIGVVRHRKK